MCQHLCSFPFPGIELLQTLETYAEEAGYAIEGRDKDWQSDDDNQDEQLGGGASTPGSASHMASSIDASPASGRVHHLFFVYYLLPPFNSALARRPLGHEVPGSIAFCP